MIAAHKWHPHTEPRTPRWTLAVALLADESLSSWLVRASLAHGCEPSTLTDWLWPGARTWTTDVDRGVTEDQCRALARASGIDAEAIEGASLAPLAARITDDATPPPGRWPWVLTLGARGVRRSGGSQLCPACLAEDAKPYLRIEWRLAWHTACEHHRTGLHDRCPECASALSPHRLGADAGHIARCATCGFDLREAALRPFAESALALQHRADAVAVSGHGACLGTEASASAWLASASFLARLVRRAARTPTRALERLLETAGCAAPQIRGQGAGTSIEGLGVEERSAVLNAVERLMGLGAEGLRDAVQEAELTQQGWCEQGETVPEPLARAVPTLPESRVAGAKGPRRSRGRGPRARHEVRQMMKRLERSAGIERD